MRRHSVASAFRESQHGQEASDVPQSPLITEVAPQSWPAGDAEDPQRHLLRAPHVKGPLQGDGRERAVAVGRSPTESEAAHKTGARRPRRPESRVVCTAGRAGVDDLTAARSRRDIARSTYAAKLASTRAFPRSPARHQPCPAACPPCRRRCGRPELQSTRGWHCANGARRSQPPGPPLLSRARLRAAVG